MLRSYLIAALRNLARSKLYAGISIFGLAIGLCAAMLASVIVRNQMTFDRFIPGYERTYIVISKAVPQGREPMVDAMAHADVAMFLKLRFREIEAVARTCLSKVRLRHGEVRSKEQIYWADPNVFTALPLRAFAGNLESALTRPDGMVLTRSVARKYFGRDDPIGATIEVGGTHSMTVTAVIEDLPPNGTTLKTGIFLSALAPYSELPLPVSELRPHPSGRFTLGGETYVRLTPRASIEPLRRALPDFLKIMAPHPPPGLRFEMDMVRIDKVHLIPELSPGIQSRLQIMIVVGALILLIACINFVNLTTARASGRAVEITLRKVAGARRRDLVLQILGESAIYVFAATLIAMMLTELLLPRLNAFFDTGATFEYWRDPTLSVCIVISAVFLTLLAGLYPAFILSAYRPIEVLKGAMRHSASTNVTRQALVCLQFTSLIVLIAAAAIAYQQRAYATSDALRVGTDQHVIVELESGQCTFALKREIAALPGVLGSACTSRSMLDEGAFSNIKLKDGTYTAIGFVPIGDGVLELFDLKPLAGRFFSESRSDDSQSPSRVVLNETAVKRFGYRSANAALGPAPVAAGDDMDVVGVVKDFTLRSIERPIGPVAYRYTPQRLDVVDVKLNGRSIPEALAGIDTVTARIAGGETQKRYFLDDYIQSLYLATLREAKAFAALSAIAVALACLGLIGLSASATDRRAKEIGIRKALGAETMDVVHLMVWQFTQPVLWSGCIAIPLSAYVMRRWLNGFAYRIELTPWPFVASAAAALAIALITVGVHCYSVARAKPVNALRYE